MKNDFKSKTILEATDNAVAGIIYTLKSQRNIKFQLIIAVIVIVLSFVFQLDIIEKIVLILSIGLVLFSEMVNTAVETTVDLVTQEYNIKAKIAKDVAAGAVVITAVNSIIIGCLVFPPKILEFFLI